MQWYNGICLKVLSVAKFQVTFQTPFGFRVALKAFNKSTMIQWSFGIGSNPIGTHEPSLCVLEVSFIDYVDKLKPSLWNQCSHQSNNQIRLN